MLKNKLAVNFGNSSNRFSVVWWRRTLSMKRPQMEPTTIRTHDSGSTLSRKWMWWKMILRTQANMSIPVKRSGLENSDHLQEALKRKKTYFVVYMCLLLPKCMAWSECPGSVCWAPWAPGCAVTSSWLESTETWEREESTAPHTSTDINKTDSGVLLTILRYHVSLKTTPRLKWILYRSQYTAVHWSHKINAISVEEEQEIEEQTRHELWEPDLNYANACIELGDG